MMPCGVARRFNEPATLHRGSLGSGAQHNRAAIDTVAKRALERAAANYETLAQAKVLLKRYWPKKPG